jgi:ABC-2 type transport system ATP-binding protein
MPPAIQTHQLVKRYGKVTAVDGVSLRVEPGEIYAFLGLNGAGKTTTIRLLLGMVKPNAGEAWVLGKAIQVGLEKPWGAVGYMVETPEAYPELSVRQNLEAMRRLRPGCPPKAVDEVIEKLGLAPYAGRRAAALSHGNAQRLGLAKALLHAPQLLILDEPANGLDPAGIVEIRELLRQLVRQQGATVFMSSHILAEVARLADRIGIIHAGRLLQELNMDELERDRQRRLLVQARDLPAAQAVLQAAGYPAVISPAVFTPAGCLEIKDLRAIQRPELIATLLVEAGQPPTGLVVEEEDLEHYFLRLIGRQEGEPA